MRPNCNTIGNTAGSTRVLMTSPFDQDHGLSTRTIKRNKSGVIRGKALQLKAVKQRPASTGYLIARNWTLKKHSNSPEYLRIPSATWALGLPFPTPLNLCK